MFIVLDLETTGLSPRKDAIIECAFIKIDPQSWKEIGRLHSYINPEREVPSLISQITGIFDSDLAWAPRFTDMRDDIQDFIENAPLIGHNIPFDISFLESHGINTSKNAVIDTFFLANFLIRGKWSLNLGYLCEYLEIHLADAHRAIDDTLATAELFMKLVNIIQNLPQEHQQYLSYFLQQANNTGMQIFYDTYLKSEKTQTWWTEDFLKKYIQDYQQNFPEKIDTFLHKEWVNAKEFVESIASFSLRYGQKTMLDIVDKNLSKWEQVLIEAPTGIGKTYAYLIPSIVWSLNMWETVHISTNTKALQDQVFYKDLSYLQENSGYDFSYSKLKGKRNYFSLTAFTVFLQDLQDSKISFIMKILFWSLETRYGELDELEFYGEEYSFLSQIHAGNIDIYDNDNIYRHWEYALWVRNSAKNANIVVTNNSILFQDIVSEGSLLWWVKNIVIDEAHNLEDVITSAMKKVLSHEYIQKTLEKWENILLAAKQTDTNFWILKSQILFQSAEIFSFCEGKIFEKFSLDAKYKNLLLQEDFFQKEEKLTLLAKNMITKLQELCSVCEDLGEEYVKKLYNFFQDIQYISDFLQLFFPSWNPEKYIYILQHNDTRWTELVFTLLHPWDFLKEYLWKECESVALTSATLQMQGSFDYIRKTLALDGFQEFALDGVFDYEKQALLYIPNDLWSIKNNLPQITVFLEKLFLATKGNMLVLFTAFSAIQDIYSQLKRKMQDEDIHLLAQSISGSKHKQIQIFRKSSHNSILLGTDTFWEWVDIPWSDLRYLVVHKIPFPVPTDPIFQARSTLYKNAFYDYSIPKAILKLKQWFWRLVRTPEDTGVIIFLDSRILHSDWWRAFYDAFPKGIKIRSGAAESLLWVLWGDGS